MYTRLVASVDHLLDRVFEAYPVRVEYQWHTRHTQQIRVALQNLVLANGHGVSLTAELIAIALERVVAVKERYRVACLACTRQTCTFQTTVIVGGYTVVERLILHCKIKRQCVPTCIIQVRLQYVHIAVPHLHYREVRLGGFVVVVDMTVVEALAIVVAETVNLDVVFEPFQICFAHLTNLGVVVIPVATGFVVRLAAVTVVCCTRSGALA